MAYTLRGVAMKPENIRLSILVSLVICSGMLFIQPVNLVLNTESVFDDPAVKRMEEERIGDYDQKGQLIIKITHGDSIKTHPSLVGIFIPQPLLI